MIKNRSVPPDDVLPHILYRDVPTAIDWLTRTFGFTECYRYGEPEGSVSGAQMHIGRAWIMLKRAVADQSTPSQLGYGTQSLTIFLNDLEAHFQTARAAGAKIIEDLHETVYGELQYAAQDLDGHHWLFSRHARNVSPEAFGSTVARYVSPLRLPCFCYLEVPAADAHHSAAFYENIFGWNIRHRDTGRPSFDDAAGNISGAWVTGRPASRDPGLLPYIWVEDIQATVASLRSHGAEIVDTPHPDNPGSTSTIATFRDPAGNLIGLYQEQE